jgi:hypothetical protein
MLRPKPPKIVTPLVACSGLGNAIAKLGLRIQVRQRSMKVLQILGALVVLTLLGCSSAEKELTQEVGRITPVEPPMFLNADVAGLFGKADFSARVEVQKGVPGTRPPMLGELSGRNGSLFFIEDAERGKRRTVGGLSALWDAPTQTAYLLDEPLQGYAPIRGVSTNGPSEVTVAGEENVGAEPCRKTILQRVVGAEMTPVLIVWRGIAQQDLPLKIQMTNSPGAVTLTLSRIRFQAPPADLFTLPNGFKRYESTDAMISELMKRRTDLISARSKRQREKYGMPINDEDAPDAINNPPRRY